MNYHLGNLKEPIFNGAKIELYQNFVLSKDTPVFVNLGVVHCFLPLILV